MVSIPKTGRGIAIALLLVGIVVMYGITITMPGFVIGAIVVAIVVGLLYLTGANLHGWLTNLYR
jgi:hypothetical protein